jgi:hypothetical protein
MSETIFFFRIHSFNGIICRVEQSVDHNLMRHISATGTQLGDSPEQPPKSAGSPERPHRVREELDSVAFSSTSGGPRRKNKLTEKQRAHLRSDMLNFLGGTRESEDELVRVYTLLIQMKNNLPLPILAKAA